MLRKHEYFYLDKNEDINEITDDILQDNPKNYKEYIDHIYLYKYLDRINIDIERDVFETKLNWEYCNFVNCFNKILNILNNTNYCDIHI